MSPPTSWCVGRLEIDASPLSTRDDTFLRLELDLLRKRFDTSCRIHSLWTSPTRLIGTNQTYSDINRSDQDMVELPASFVAQIPGKRVGSGPWTYMVYGAGD